MDATSGPLLQLQGGELLPMQGVRLSVEQGIVWVTCAGDLDDHFLRAGDTMLLERGAEALVGVDAPARLRITPHRDGRAMLRAWQQRHRTASPRPPIAWDIDERPAGERQSFSLSR